MHTMMRIQGNRRWRTIGAYTHTSDPFPVSLEGLCAIPWRRINNHSTVARKHSRSYYVMFINNTAGAYWMKVADEQKCLLLTYSTLLLTVLYAILYYIYIRPLDVFYSPRSDFPHLYGFISWWWYQIIARRHKAHWRYIMVMAYGKQQQFNLTHSNKIFC